MARYIPKDALVAEIERRKQVAFGWMETAPNDAIEAEFKLCDDILSFLDTLEVKEVDLEKELIKWHKEHFKKDGTFIGMSGFYLANNSQMGLAKHFFELGMAVSNKAQKGE